MSPGFLYGLASGICFGWMGYLVHACAGRIPVTQLAFYRGAIACVVLLPFLGSQVTAMAERRALPIWIRSVAGAVSILCYFTNLQASNVGTATTYGNLSHIFVALLGWKFRNLRITRLQLGGIALAVGGATLLTAGSIRSSATIALVGMAGALTASVSYLALREAAQEFSASLVVFGLGAAGMAACLLVPGPRWVTPDLALWALIVGVGITGMVGQVLMTRSFLYLPPHVASVLALTSLIWGVLIEVLWDHRHPAALDWASYAVVLSGVALLKISAKKGILEAPIEPDTAVLSEAPER